MPQLCSEEALRDGLNQVPLPDQAAVEATAGDWADLWQSNAVYDPGAFPIDMAMLSLLGNWAIRTAAESFPIGTGLGHDNIAPRALLRLSEAAISALALLFAAFERLGRSIGPRDLGRECVDGHDLMVIIELLKQKEEEKQSS